MKRTPWLAAAAVMLSVLVSGCAATVALTPADDAANKSCASEIVHLPATVGDLAQRDTNAQGTGAWGTPTAVVLTCGVAIPAPTATQECVLVGSVYWLRDDSQESKKLYTFTSYGRDPATQVLVDDNVVAGGAALYDLEAAVAYTKPNGHECTSISDSLDPSPTPTP